VDPGSPELDRSTSAIRADFLADLRAMFGAFEPEDVLASQVARAQIAEPIRPTGASAPELFPVAGLTVASSAHTYPDIVHGQAILGVAEQVVSGLEDRLPKSDHQLRAA
jgi:hypothetical protein